MRVLVSFPSLLVPCTFSLISLCIFLTSSILRRGSSISVSILITSVLNSASDRLAISTSLSSVLGALICSSVWAVFLCLGTFVSCKGRSHRYSPGGATHFAALWHCMGGGVPEGTVSLLWLSPHFQSLLPLPTSKLGPSGADSRVGGLVYILGPFGSLQRAIL